MTDDIQKQQFAESTKSTVDAYLRMFPDETGRQAEFIRHLTNPALDLRLRSTIPEGHVCASGVLLLPGDKILMLEHKALGIWVVPGGHYDVEDVDLTTTAIREAREETGLSGIHLHPWHTLHKVPLDIDTHPIPAREEKNEGAHQHFDFRYILEADDPDKILDRLSLDTTEVLAFDAIHIDAVDTKSSIFPTIEKLHLLG